MRITGNTFEDGHSLLEAVSSLKEESFFAGVEQLSAEENSVEETIELPVLPLRDNVIFPLMVVPIFLGRECSLRALEAAQEAGLSLLAVAQRDTEVVLPGVEDLYSIGVEVTIGRTLRLPDGNVSLLVQGRRRVRILEFTQQSPYLKVRAVTLPEKHVSGVAVEALMRAVLTFFDRCVKLDDDLPDDAYVAAMNVDQPGWLADLIAHIMNFSVTDRQMLLEMLNPLDRLQSLSAMLARELRILELENHIQEKVQTEMDKSQREYLLREQLRAIQAELDDLGESVNDVELLRQRLNGTPLPEGARERAERELRHLAAMPPIAPEAAVLRTYLEWMIDLPWQLEKRLEPNLREAARILETEHYGLKKAKERILEHIAVRQLAGDKMNTPILCFVGPPGTGKTSMGRSIAKATGRKFVRVSLGGIRDEAEIRGHRRTYIGAMPGRLIETMRSTGVLDPLFMLDEVDKLGVDFRGDPSAALLEALDREQNKVFSDHYLEVPYDLSHVFFILTANSLHNIPPALLDRMEIVEFPGYIETEKLEIARRFLLPRQVVSHGMGDYRLRFPDKTILRLIREYTYEAGVRNLDRNIANVIRKVARRLAEGRKAPHVITPASVERYLGPPYYTFGKRYEQDEVGLAMGVAWTEGGGDVMPVEVTIMDGKGSLLLTGQMGDVMQESAQAALSYVRSHAADFGFEDANFNDIDVHIHVPEGAVPKDGPSAGVTMITALTSALSGRPVRHDVCMTGEITLRGRVLPVGGVREKILAAQRAGIPELILPKRNEKDLVDIPKQVLKHVRLYKVTRVEQALALSLAEEHFQQRNRVAS